MPTGKRLCPLLLGDTSKDPARVVLAFEDEDSLLMNHDNVYFSEVTFVWQVSVGNHLLYSRKITPAECILCKIFAPLASVLEIKDDFNWVGLFPSQHFE